jgi:hypothetical protein
MAIEILSKTDKIYYLFSGNSDATKNKNWKPYTAPLLRKSNYSKFKQNK